MFEKLLLIKKIISSGLCINMIREKTTNTTSNKDMQTDLQM